MTNEAFETIKAHNIASDLQSKGETEEESKKEK